MSLQKRFIAQLLRALSLDTVSAQPLQTLSQLQRVASHLKIRLCPSQEARCNSWHRGERPDCFVPNQDNTGRHFNFISPLGINRDYCSGLLSSWVSPSTPSRFLLLSPTDIDSAALPDKHPTTHWTPLLHLLSREYNLWYLADGGTSFEDQVSREGQTY